MQVAIPLSFELKLKAPSTEEVMAAIQKCLDPRFVSQDPVSVPAIATPPAIGEVWPGQGGIYAGVARGRDGEPDYHLILCAEAPTTDFNWQAALEFSKTIVADGHKDFTVPSRWESALLYANLQDKLDDDYWHWTSTQSSEHHAFSQHFYYGGQSTYSKDSERRCRFVRRSVI
jgi:hypothetical protein